MNTVFCQITIEANVSCGAVISDIINTSESHYYLLSIDGTYDVNFDDCQSDTDLTVFFFDNAGQDVSNLFCSGGDDCGQCDNGAQYVENFTMTTIKPGKYFIRIDPYSAGGDYDFQITCNLPQSDDCDYFSFDAHHISSGQLITNSVTVISDIIEIQFDIKISDYCILSSCNIFYIGNNETAFPSLSINGENNYLVFELISHGNVYDMYSVPNANTILPLDQYHTIYLLHTPQTEILKIDDITYYSVQSDIDHLPQSINSSYMIYISSPWSASIDGIVTNMCIKSLTKRINGEINCGETVNGYLSSESDIDYYYFNLSKNTTSVFFDGCNSYIYTQLILYDTNFQLLYEDQYGFCNGPTTILIDVLSVGEYILSVGSDPLRSGYTKSKGVWEVSVTCNYNEPDHTKPYTVIGTTFGWLEASIICESQLGTTLATITTAEDMEIAIEIAENAESHIGEDPPVWIGLHKDAVTGYSWQWADGTTCNASKNGTGECVQNIHWSTQSDAIQSSGSYINISYVDSSWTITEEPLVESDIIGKVLCNAPHSKYSIKNCDKEQTCWRTTSCCHNAILNSDSFSNELVDAFGIRRVFDAQLAVWNSKLYVVGLSQIHFTNFELFTTDYSWEHVSYNENGEFRFLTFSQQTSQYRSSLFILAINENYEDYLMKVDLDTMKITKYSNTLALISESEYESLMRYYTYCMVSSGNHVYIARGTDIATFDLQSESWSTSRYDTTLPSACAITNDHNFVYIFGANYLDDTVTILNVFKYNTKDGTTTHTGADSLCYPVSAVRSIVAGNGKIVIHGCYIASWKSLIFDPEIDQFESHTIDIPIPTDINEYRAASLASYDDNVLLLQTIENNSIALYFTITESVSINFTNTQTSYTTWPSDGFDIKYYLNDFTNLSNNIYYVWFSSDDPSNDIAVTVVLNTTIDNCDCSQKIYNCADCSQHFELSDHLLPIDNYINRLIFSLSKYSPMDNHTLIIPDYIIIELERCHISFSNNQTISTSDELMVAFTFNISENCKSRIGMEFSSSIMSPMTDINKEITIFVLQQEQICEICDIVNVDDCSDCTDGAFELQHKAINDDTFSISFSSNMVDFTIDKPSNFDIVYSEIPSIKVLTAWDSFSTAEQISVIIGPILFVLIVFGIIYYYYKKFANEKRRRLEYARDIHNPMVLSIGIAVYHDAPKNPGIKNINCDNLDGIDRDCENISKWCKLLNYKMYPENLKLEWTQQDIIAFITKHAEELSENITNEEISKKYDAIVLVISGHGYTNNVILSDYQLISKTAVHRLLSTNYPALRDIPRVFIFDCCSGSDQRSHYESNVPDSSDEEEDGSEEKNYSNDKGKNFAVGDIELNKQTSIWKKDQKNPDYMISLIHGANEGFQAKMNSIDGSYLIYEYVKRMIDNFENDKNLFFGEIIDGIQQYLHDQGKQQITAVFNNNTRYLRFKKHDDTTDQRTNRYTGMETAESKVEENIDIEMIETDRTTDIGNNLDKKRQYSAVDTNNSDKDY